MQSLETLSSARMLESRLNFGENPWSSSQQVLTAVFPKKVLMDVFRNELGHILAFIGVGRHSIAIRLQANEHRIWIWFLLGVEVFVVALVSRLAYCLKLITCFPSLGINWLAYAVNDLSPLSAEGYRHLHFPPPDIMQAQYTFMFNLQNLLILCVVTDLYVWHYCLNVSQSFDT
jgi:hypothetical protein